MQPSTVQGNSSSGIQFPNNRSGFENAELSSKFKKKNTRTQIQDNNITPGQVIQQQTNNNFNGTGSNKQPIYPNAQLNSNQNRKLTPNKVNIGLKANTSLGQHPTAMRPGDMGRNFDVSMKKNGKNNSRSNTIEQQFDKDSKKSVKRKERASSTIEHADNGADPNMALMANGQS